MKGGNILQELFGQKYKECERALYLVAISYVHNTEDAKDCVQEAVLSAFKAFGRLRNKEHFRTWITRITINKCKDCLRRKRYTEELIDNINVFYNMPLEEMEIIDCICRLKPELSLYISLRFYSDMTYEETAKTLRLPVSTVKYRTKRALEELRKIMEGDV